MQAGFRIQKKRRAWFRPSFAAALVFKKCLGKQEKLAGWVARTRPLAEPLSPRGPQPVLRKLLSLYVSPNGPPEPANGVRGSWYALFSLIAEQPWLGAPFT